jgi:hypothetical protein
MRKTSTQLAVAAALVASAAAAAPAADAAVPGTGTWSGDHSQLLGELVPGADPIPYETNMVISEYQGRIKTVVGTVRMECPSIVGVRDIRVLKSWKVGRGPTVSRRGSFRFWADKAYFHGTLSRSSAVGGTLATYGDGPDGPLCRGVGRYNLQRRH